ncbi:hypothetical protein PASE110613_05485 [Paenibacillus sediminis]|uniref:Lipoprotein YajG n=1 Tax=Paenibacillus sediminis TaxID=664909 RepID=A0ABS4H129_9BACL|nr:hypothetical protein [Paenibacillus sediminis]MBP1936229.1 putative lipoprotein YajG [Paenibacillus sediminis]
MRRIFIIALLLLTSCSSKENAIITSNDITTTVTTSKDQKYIENVGYSVSLENKGKDDLHIIEVEPVLNEVMKTKVKEIPLNMVNLSIPVKGKVLVEGKFNLIPETTTQKEATKEEIFKGLNLKLQNGEILYIPL